MVKTERLVIDLPESLSARLKDKAKKQGYNRKKIIEKLLISLKFIDLKDKIVDLENYPDIINYIKATKR